MPDYDIRITVHADDAIEAQGLLRDVSFPSSIDVISTSMLEYDVDHEEKITKTTFLVSVLHRTEDEVEDFEQASELIADQKAISFGALISSTGISREDLESELIEMGDDGDFFVE